MTRSRRWLVLPVAFAALATAPASGASQPRPCSLLSNTEVAKALGVKIQTRTASRAACEWQSVPLGNFTTANRTLEIDVVPATKARFESLKKHDPRFASIRGVGDLAYIFPDANGSYVLYVWHDGFGLTLSAVDVSTPLETEKALAKIVLTRL